MIVSISFNCDNNYTDYTNSVEVNDLSIDKKLGDYFESVKDQTGTIILYGNAYFDVKLHLVDSPNMYSNSICVKVELEFCDKTYFFKADNKNIKWCENDSCKMQLYLNSYSPEIDCVKNTPISDNANGAFNDYDVNGIVHPRFRYCDTIRPTVLFGFLITVANAIDILVAMVNAIISVINLVVSALNSLTGGNIGTITLIAPIFNLIADCRRGYPSPYVRSYIDNVCSICGITTNQFTAPLFYSSFHVFDTNKTNHYYSLALLTAFTGKGVLMNGTQTYSNNSRPSWTLSVFLNKLLQLFNARWFIKDQTLYINHKTLISETIYGNIVALDLTDDAVKSKIIQEPCYSWNGEGKYSRINLNYNTDAIDAEGNELLKRFNGEYISAASPNNTETLEVFTLDFSTPCFVSDGTDHIYDDNLLNALGALINNWDEEGVLKVRHDSMALNKLIIHDTNTPLSDARSIWKKLVDYMPLPSLSDDMITWLGYDNLYWNYPMSFDVNANNTEWNLFKFFECEIPTSAKKTNIKFEVILSLCCAFLSLDLYQRIKLNDSNIGEIDSITFDYRNMQVKIKGNII